VRVDRGEQIRQAVGVCRQSNQPKSRVLNLCGLALNAWIHESRKGSNRETETIGGPDTRDSKTDKLAVFQGRCNATSSTAGSLETWRASNVEHLACGTRRP
jgi:hypothetical protein